MTKHVRIENADTSTYKVEVQTWERGQNGEPDKLVASAPLDYPTNMVDLTIWKERYLIVKESEA